MSGPLGGIFLTHTVYSYQRNICIAETYI